MPEEKMQEQLNDLMEMVGGMAEYMTKNMVTKDEFYREINPLKQDVSGLKQDVSEIKDELVSVNGRLGMLERDMKDVKHELQLLDRRTQEDVDMVIRDMVVLKQKAAL